MILKRNFQEDKNKTLNKMQIQDMKLKHQNKLKKQDKIKLKHRKEKKSKR